MIFPHESQKRCTLVPTGQIFRNPETLRREEDNGAGVRRVIGWDGRGIIGEESEGLTEIDEKDTFF